MVKKLILILLILLIMPLILALDTQLDVNSGADRKITIRFMDDQGTIEGGGFLNLLSDGDGKVSATFSSDKHNKIRLSILVRDSNDGLVYNQPFVFKDVKTGWVYSIDLTQPNPILKQISKFGEPNEIEEPKSNETELTETEIEEVTDEIVKEEPIEEVAETSKKTTKASITGSDIKDISGSKKITYVIIGIIIVILVVFILLFLHFKKEKSKTSDNIKVTKYSELKSKKDQETIEDAEEKIKAAQDNN